jgi:hypothetical protein
MSGLAASGNKAAAFATKLTLVANTASIVSTKIADMVVESQSLAKAMQAVNTDMSDFNRRTDGLINTMDGLQGAIRLQNAGLNLTSKEFGSIGAAAAKFAQDLGEGPEGMTRQFNRLVKAISTGRESAFKELGIDIKATADITEFQAEAIAKLTAKYGDLEVQAQTLDEKVFAFNNTLDTVNAALVAGFVERAEDSWRQFNTTIFGGVDALMAYEEEVLATDGAIAEWDTSITGVINKINRMGATMAENAVAVAAFFGVDISDSYLVGQLGRNAQMAEIERLEEVKRGMEAKQRKDAQERAAQERRNQNQDTNLKPPRKPKMGKGQTFDFSEAEAGIADPFELSTAAQAQLGELDFVEGPQFDISGPEEQAARDAAIQAQFDSLIEIQATAEEEMTRKTEEETARRQSLQASYVDGVSNLMDSLVQLSNDGSKEGFEASKAFAYSANIVNTLVASMAAVKNALEFGGPAGIALAAIQSAAVMAQGAATGRRIRQQKYQKGSTSGSVSGASSGRFNTGSMGGGSDSGGGVTMITNVSIEGQTVAESVMRANDRASQNGQRHLQVAGN